MRRRIFARSVLYGFTLTMDHGERREKEGDKMQATKAAMVKIWRVIIAHGDAKRERRKIEREREEESVGRWCIQKARQPTLSVELCLVLTLVVL